MANFNKSDGRLRPAPQPVKAKRAAPKKEKPNTYECRACGFVTAQTDRARNWTLAEACDGMCLGCAKHFGVDAMTHQFGMGGATNLSLEETLQKMDEIQEAEHVLIMKSGSFGVGTFGESMGVDFGDIFHVARVGTVEEGTPNGQYDFALASFTISIKVNGHDLRLFPHEVAPIHWVRIMELKKSKEYEEAYLTTSDQSGYWKPSDETKAEIVAMYGDR